ncbi:MAG: hypothetical protein PVI25_04670 [Gammaproteobacteria bacterium]|jgi:hypothetical protein
MTYLQRYRNRPAGGRQFFWNPLARALIVFFLLMALILLAANGIGGADCGPASFIAIAC